MTKREERKRFRFKILLKGRVAPIGRGVWPKVGTWTREVKNPKNCISGWHLGDKSFVITAAGDYADSRRNSRLGYPPIELYLAEGRGAVDGIYDKRSFAQARLLKKLGTIKVPRTKHTSHYGSSYIRVDRRGAIHLAARALLKRFKR